MLFWPARNLRDKPIVMLSMSPLGSTKSRLVTESV